MDNYIIYNEFSTAVVYFNFFRLIPLFNGT